MFNVCLLLLVTPKKLIIDITISDVTLTPHNHVMYI